MRTRAAVATAGAVLLLVAVAGVTLTLSTSSASRYASAVQVFSSLALLLVTSVYVYLTYRILAAQENPRKVLRMQSEERALDELMQMLSASPAQDLTLLRPSFEIGAGAEKPHSFSEVGWRAWWLVVNDLQRLLPLIPEQLRPACAYCISEVGTSALTMNIFKIALLSEEVAAAAEGRSWNYDGAKRLFERDIWSAQDGPAPSFDDLARGAALESAITNLRRLNAACDRFRAHENVTRRPNL